MTVIERWWRVTRPSDGHVTWTDEDPSDRLVAAWEGAKVEGPFVPEPPRGAVEALEAAREFAGNFIRYVDDDERLLAEQAWDVVRKVNATLGGQ